MPSAAGKVYLVGAGPGDPGLLTLRGAECLRRADVVFYDYLSSPLLLAHARKAEHICLGRHGQGRIMSPAETNVAMISAARAGRVVVRLKGGDPTIFARSGDELAALEAADVPYEIVPGITAAQAASSYAGIPLTDRDHASCVALVAGQESAEKDNANRLDYGALATFPGTLVFYMGVTTAPQWSRELIEAGKSAETPVAIVRRGSWPDQQTIATTLGEVGKLLGSGAGKLRPPAVIIVGEVARDSSSSCWFTATPLFGRTILVTRPEHQADELTGQLRELGADVLVQPAITISEPASWAAVDSALSRLGEFDWIVFSSANGVNYFLSRNAALGGDTRRLASVRLAAIGPATVAELERYCLKADLSPDEYRAEVLAAALGPQVSGKRVLLVRASRGREVLAESLAAAGAKVEQVVAYESRDVEQPDPTISAALAAGDIDWTTVTSSAIARSLAKLFGDSLRRTRLAAISPLTAGALQEAGYTAAVVAHKFTSSGIVSAILVDAASGPKG